MIRWTLHLWALVALLMWAVGTWPTTASASSAKPGLGPRCAVMSSANTALSGFSATSRPVVLVHGWDGSASKMMPIASALESLPVTPYLFDYQAHNTTWPAKPVIASCLATYIDAVSAGYKRAGGDGKIIIVAHSMGGLATLFSSNAEYAATPDGQVLGGVVTVDTPYLGSPFGNQAVSRGFEALPLVGGAHPTSLFFAPAGSDASVCLASHAPPSNVLPNGCALAPYLPPGVPLTELAGDMTVKRTLFGIPLYSVDLGTDGPVPVASAQGYVASGANGRDPNRREITPVTIPCTVDFDQIASIAAAQGFIQGGGKGLFAGLTDLLSPGIFADSNALGQLQSGRLGRELDAFLAAAYLGAPCSHGGMLTDPASLHAIVGAVKGDLARLSPTVPRESQRPQLLATGSEYSCALLMGGRVDCWGGNGGGQLGSGGDYNTFNGPCAHQDCSLTPVTAKGLSGAVSISGGFQAVCALLSSGGVDCWGASSGYGGAGGVDGSSVPVAVPGLSRVSAISAGYNHSCALVVGGTARCWGDNTFGELGDSSETGSEQPVAVEGLSGATAISAGTQHTCALVSGGRVVCWGSGAYADGTDRISAVPVTLAGLSGVRAIAAGANSCALLADGTVDCWSEDTAPLAVPGIVGATAVSAGYDGHDCALLAGGRVDCWGPNSDGQLGNHTNSDSNAPVAVSGLSGATAISAGPYHTCALLASGRVDCWGANSDGQLGNHATSESNTPVAVTGLP